MAARRRRSTRSGPGHGSTTTSMNTHSTVRQHRPDRRSFLRRAAGLLAGAGAATALAPQSLAAFGPGKVPTDLALSVTAQAAFNGTITVSARLRRLDGNTAGLAGQKVQFYAGNATYPSTNLGYYWTGNDGSLRFTFRANTLQRRGTYVLIADVNPTGSEGWIASPRPYAWFKVI